MEYQLPLQQFVENVEKHPDKPYLHQPHNRVWRALTWGEVDDQARRIASGLRAHGLNKGNRIAILAQNSAEWFIADFAIMMAGMISVPIYATAGEPTIRHILSHSGAQAVFLGKLACIDAANAAIDADMLTIAFPYPTATANEKWSDWLLQYDPLSEINQPGKDDIFSLVYTSGSTGLPKGVVLSYDNVASSSYAYTQLEETIPEGERGMSYLPLAHITERCVVELPSLYMPGDIFFVESLETFIDDVRYARPTLFLSVPRLWVKFQAQILAKMPDRKLQRLLRIPIVRGIVARKIREGMGLDQTRLFGSGSAPISPSILDWYAKLGIQINEGWGMTETSGLSCCNHPYKAERMGTIGEPVECVQMKLSEDGEILIRGPAVFKEYYNNPQETTDAFLDGWFRTGDRAEILSDGAWKIIGRLKEQFKTGKGKYVAPVPIESLFGVNPDIEQVCVLGSGRKQPIAVVVPSADTRLAKNEIHDHLLATLKEVNSHLESHQRPDHIIVAKDAWTIENELLTPTLKLKRDQIEALYRRYLDCDLPDEVVWEEDL